MTDNPALNPSNSTPEGGSTALCPCGSGKQFTLCCQPAISGQQPATSAERLMRSRYTAFVQGKVDYLIATTHPKDRSGLDRANLIDPQIRWLNLKILKTRKGGIDDSRGQVQFIATFNESGTFASLEENSHFSNIDQRWYYHTGEARVKAIKPERNAPCPCGSTQKFKRCCGRPR